MATKIEIALKTVTKIDDKKVPLNFKSIVESEYAVRYLDSFGANPTRENLAFVTKHSPISSAVLLPVWTKDTLVILPNCQQDPDTIDLQEVFKTEVVGAEVIHNPQEDPLLKEIHKRSQALYRRPSTRAIIDGESAEYFRETKIHWNSERNGEFLLPIIQELSVNDIKDKRFLKMAIKIRFDEEVIISALSEYSKSLKAFAPMLKRDLEGKVSSNLIRLLSSATFLQFYGNLFESCQNILVDIVSVSLEQLKLKDGKSYESAKKAIQEFPESLQVNLRDLNSEVLEVLDLYNQCVEDLNEKVVPGS